jgi:hypothetical protein
MITNDGKEVLSKFLLGQAPAYATHIAIGCGAKPLESNDSMPEGSENKNALDFETLRIPISSRGFVQDGENLKIALTAELPTENRYEISEIGLWSAANNSLARGFDSRVFFDFQEPWQAHDTTIRAIPILSPLGTGVDIDDQGNTIFIGESKDPVLQNTLRRNRQEGLRFLNRAIFMRGDSSEITGADGSWVASEESTHIHLNNVSFNIGRNNPADVLTLAFSVLNYDALASDGDPDFVKILIEFFRNEISTETGFAKTEIYVDQSDLENNRYQAFKIPISDLINTPDFTASEIRVARIFVYIEKDGNPSEDHYVALDGFRLDNITTNNPLYKMVGYSIIKNDNAYPVIKYNNTNNYIEFRFGLGVS